MVAMVVRTCHPSDKTFGGFMFDFFFPTHPFGGQTLRLVAQAQQDGGDVFDIARACARIEPGDKDGWEREWLNLAQQIENKGKEALAAGHRDTAIQHFFHANQYYRMSDVFLTIAQESKKKERFRKAQENFRAAARLHDPRMEIITVRWDGVEYDGSFWLPTKHKPAQGHWCVSLCSSR